MKNISFKLDFIAGWLVYLSAGKATRFYILSVLKRDLGLAPIEFKSMLRLLLDDPNRVIEGKALHYLDQNLVDHIRRGLVGEPIYEELLLLRQEFLEENQFQLEKQIQRLPSLLSLILIFLIFPSYLN